MPPHRPSFRASSPPFYPPVRPCSAQPASTPTHTPTSRIIPSAAPPRSAAPQRLVQRTEGDLLQLETVGHCRGIENYARHLAARAAGEPPDCLVDYFPADPPPNATTTAAAAAARALGFVSASPRPRVAD